VGVLVNWWSDLEQDAVTPPISCSTVPLTAGEIRCMLAAVPTRPSRERAVTPSQVRGTRRCSRAARERHQRGRVRKAPSEPSSDKR
jgi:hypothetical protein